MLNNTPENAQNGEATVSIEILKDPPLPTTRYEPDACCPEWCDEDERDGQPHGPVCPEGPLNVEHYTKRMFVVGVQANAEQAIWSYLFGRAEGYSHEDALAQAVSEAEEAATCFAGIGSCGRGWCQHS